MAIALGKDATVSVDNTITGVRNVTFSTTARTIDVEEYGSRYVAVYQTGRDGTLTMEINDDEDVSALFDALNNGTEVTVTGGESGWNFPAVVTSISESAAVDGVVTYQVEARLTKENLRA